ncbi:MAG: RluA family pseudouridine synthase [Verrucomicrobiota bacterium]
MSGPGSKPLLDWVLLRHPETPRGRAKQWIVSGRVSIRGQIIRRPQELIPDPGPGLELGGRRATTLDCGSGWKIHPRLSVLYLDHALAVVDKGPGLLSVPGPRDEPSALGVLADVLSGRLAPRDRAAARRSVPAAYRALQPLPVHRLDQYTSGALCIAMNPAARESLIDQVRSHRMNRVYIAYVEGRPKSPRGTWRDWVQLSEDELRQEIVPRTSRGSGPPPTEAVTHYEVLAEYPLGRGGLFAAKLRIRLETGLKHQIRAQAAHAGLPLIGDRAYNPGARRSAPALPCLAFERQALHAESLALEHPDRPGATVSWSVELPRDLRRLEAGLVGWKGGR